MKNLIITKTLKQKFTRFEDILIFSRRHVFHISSKGIYASYGGFEAFGLFIKLKGNISLYISIKSKIIHFFC